MLGWVTVLGWVSAPHHFAALPPPAEPLCCQVLFLQQHSKEKVIVYFLTCNCVDFYALALKRLGPKFLPGLQVGAASRALLIGAAHRRAQGCIPAQQCHGQGQSHDDREWAGQLCKCL